jgi:hypothetical protein
VPVLGRHSLTHFVYLAFPQICLRLAGTVSLCQNHQGFVNVADFDAPQGNQQRFQQRHFIISKLDRGFVWFAGEVFYIFLNYLKIPHLL